MTLLKLTSVAFLLSAYTSLSSAESIPISDNAQTNTINEVWFTPGFYSHHFQGDQKFNDNNLGFGIEYRYSTTYAVTAGRYNNSVRKSTNYAALVVQPLSLGPVRLGAVLGVINGYPEINNGNWFPLIIPVASYEYKNVGINLTYIPTIQDTIYGALALQLKLKIY